MPGIDFNEPPFDIESGRYDWGVFHASPHARAKEKMLRHALKMASLATGAGAAGILYKAKEAYDRFRQRAAKKRQRQSQLSDFYPRRKRTIYEDYVPLETPGYCENKPVNKPSQNNGGDTIKTQESGNSVVMYRKSTGNDVNNLLVIAPKRGGQRLSKPQYIQFCSMPAFHGRKIETAQIEWTSPNQSIATKIYYDNQFLANCYECANRAIANQSQTSVNAETGSYPMLNGDLAAQSAASFLGNQNLKRTSWVVYNRKVIDRFVNTSVTTVTFTLYYMRTANPLGRVATNTTPHPNSLLDLLNAMQNDAAGSDQFFRTTNNLADGTVLRKRSHTTYGQNPIDYPGVKRYYKCFRTRVFTLKPGESCNIQTILPGKKVLNGGTYVDYWEYPGTTYTVLIRAQATLVGEEGSSNVSYGNGQYQHISEISASCRILPMQISYKQDFGVPVSISEANQEIMNVETGQKDTTHNKL